MSVKIVKFLDFKEDATFRRGAPTCEKRVNTFLYYGTGGFVFFYAPNLGAVFFVNLTVYRQKMKIIFKFRKLF